MNKYELDIPEVGKKKNFTIIYKGREEENEGEERGKMGIKERIEEILTNKEELFNKLRYFKRRMNEINQINEISIHDEYSITTFKTFIKSIETNKIEITDENISDISALSHKYEYYELEGELSQFSQRRPDIQGILNERKDDGYKFQIEDEEKLSKHLDICLMNENFINFPISILSRILNSPKRVLNDHHLLFEFVKKLIRKYEKENENEEGKEEIKTTIEIIVSSLDLNEMTDEEIEEYLEEPHFVNIFESRQLKERLKRTEITKKNQEERLKKIEKEKQAQEERLKKFEKEKQAQEERLKLIENQLLKKEEIYVKIEERLNKQEKTMKEYLNKSEELESIINKQKIEIKELEEISTKYRMMKERIEEQERTIKEYQASRMEIEEMLKAQEKRIKTLEQMKKIKCKIEAKVDVCGRIKGKIEIEGEEEHLDKARSKYILNTNPSRELGESSYKNGNEIKEKKTEFLISKTSGTYFLHSMIVDKFGNIEELISKSLTTKGIQPILFEYTGRVQAVKLTTGRYKLEVWGSEGGENTTNLNSGTYSGYPGKGGYSSGTLEIKEDTTLYVYFGGHPQGETGGWNGGGSGSRGGAGGGGSTDISLSGEEGCTEWNTREHMYSRLIVAGGGGGSSHTSYPNWRGGNGGGTNGENNGNYNVNGGTQTNGYEFGIGESNTVYHNSGGGGGWYGGGAYNKGGWGRGGGGGSGFVYNSSSASNYPSGCKLNSSFYLTNSTTICGKEEIPKPNGKGTENGHSGNGYAKISLQ